MDSELQKELASFDDAIAMFPQDMTLIVDAARKVANAMPMHAESGGLTWYVCGEGDPLEGWLIVLDPDAEEAPDEQ